jgi:hypothetical protein
MKAGYMRLATNILMTLGLIIWGILFGLYANGFYRLYKFGWPLGYSLAALLITALGVLAAFVVPIWLRRRNKNFLAMLASGIALILAVAATVLSFVIAASAT